MAVCRRIRSGSTDTGAPGMQGLVVLMPDILSQDSHCLGRTGRRSGSATGKLDIEVVVGHTSAAVSNLTGNMPDSADSDLIRPFF